MALLIVCLFTIGCAGPPPPAEDLPPVGGAWKQVNDRGDEVTYTFGAKSKYSKKYGARTARGEYRVEGGKIHISPRVGKPSVLEDWKIEGNTLSWTLPTGVRVRLTRVEEKKSP